MSGDTAIRRAELVRVFGRIGLLSFGGPAAQIALMHRELVETRRWLSERQFLNALSFCMLLPGPEAMQLATYAGWRLRGIPGGLIAGGLFVLPGAALIALLALVYLAYGDVPLVAALFTGVQAAVVVIVLQALVSISRRALTSRGAYLVAGLAFAAIYGLSVPFPLVVLAAAAAGAWAFSTAEHPGDPAPRPALAWRLVVIFGALWMAPIALAAAAGAAFLRDLGLFFAQLAIVTFGGAYAVLAWMAQIVVQDFAWLTTGQMIDALGLAETTPGPLILVTQFVGMVAGFGQGGTPLALLSAAMVLWVTFVPCFLWIFAGAPFIEWIAGKPRLTGALRGITAAVVGVIASLSLWFALHVFFDAVTPIRFGPLSLDRPDPATLDATAAGLALLAALMLFAARRGVATTLAITAAAAGALHLAGVGS